MSDLMLDIMMWLLFLIVIAVGIFLLFLIFYGIYYIITDETKKELKAYTIQYSVNGYKGFCCVKAKNKKQAIKEFRRYYIYISNVKEIE